MVFCNDRAARIFTASQNPDAGGRGPATGIHPRHEKFYVAQRVIPGGLPLLLEALSGSNGHNWMSGKLSCITEPQTLSLRTHHKRCQRLHFACAALAQDQVAVWRLALGVGTQSRPDPTESRAVDQG